MNTNYIKKKQSGAYYRKKKNDTVIKTSKVLDKTPKLYNYFSTNVPNMTSKNYLYHFISISILFN